MAVVASTTTLRLLLRRTVRLLPWPGGGQLPVVAAAIAAFAPSPTAAGIVAALPLRWTAPRPYCLRWNARSQATTLRSVAAAAATEVTVAAVALVVAAAVADADAATTSLGLRPGAGAAALVVPA